MAKLKKPVPKFNTEKEESEYWDNHSLFDHFDVSDFKALKVKTSKDTPITIRLDSESRRILEEISQVHKVGPSTLARTFIVIGLEQWKRKQQISLTLEDAAQALIQPMPDELKQQIFKLFEESKAGNYYLLPESELERVSKIFVRNFFEAAGYKITPDKRLNEDPSENKVVSGLSIKR